MEISFWRQQKRWIVPRKEEGDYLKLSIERIAAPSKKNTIVPVYQSGSSTKVAYYEHHIQLLVNYYTTWNQEQAMTQRIAQVLADLDLGGMSDYEKIETIYSYVCRTVAYDNSDDDLKFSVVRGTGEPESCLPGICVFAVSYAAGSRD